MTDYGAVTLWLVVLLVGVGAQALRFSFVVAFAWIDRVPPRVAHALGFVPAAVLAALVAPDVFAPEGAIVLAWPRIGAATIAAVVAWRTGNVAATIGVGLVALWLLGSLPM